MMAETFEAECLRGSPKPPQIRVRVTRLSITFLLEDRAINSSFFVEDHKQISKNFSGQLRDRFQNYSGTSYVRFQLFYRRETQGETHLLLTLEQLSFQFLHPIF